MLHSKTIRIFISSTFRDMHSERDYLVKYIFPELRERCMKKGLSLVDVDLRWGVTEEQEKAGQVLPICLDEVEDCRPFFIGILGERYGHTPTEYQVPDQSKYDWVKKFEKGHSLTALEIYHGVLNQPEMRPRAFFYFRNPGFITHVPESKRKDVMSESPEYERKLHHLKEDIRDSFSVHQIPGHITENYPCSYKGLKISWESVKASIGNQLKEEDINIMQKAVRDDNLIDNTEYAKLNEEQQKIIDQHSYVYLDGLEAFGNATMADLWKAIDEEYPAQETQTDPVLIEKTYHNRFMDSRTRMFVGREDTIDLIQTYLSDAENHKPLFITGEPGSGKSAVMAVVAQQTIATRSNGLTIVRFIGASPGSLDINKLVLGILHEIALHYHFVIDDSRLEDPNKLYEYFREFIFKAGRIGHLTLFIDALNQLNPISDPHHLIWLPKYIPENVKIVLSSLEGIYIANAVKYELPILRLGNLSLANSTTILQTTLGEYRKTLSDNQIKSILNKEDAGKPLYLKVASEELRMFPDFDHINARIDQLAGSIPGLFTQMLERLEVDHSPELVKNAMSLIECSMFGLLETELIELLRPPDKEKLPLNTWARLYRNLAPYLLTTDDNREGLLDFFHQQLSTAVQERYLKDKEPEKQYYKKLAEYGLGKYNLKNGDITNTVLYTGIYLYKAKEEEKLYQLLRDIFTSENLNYDLFEEIASTLYDWVVDTSRYDIEITLISLTRYLAENDKPLLFASFLVWKSSSYKINGNMRWALEFCENSVLVMQSMVGREFENRNFNNYLSLSLNNLGDIYSDMGETKMALEYFEKSMKLMESLLANEPDRIDFSHALTESFSKVGNLYSDMGDTKNAMEYLEKSMKMRESLVAKEPGRTDFIHKLMASFHNVGNVYIKTGDAEKALEYFEKSTNLMESLLAKEPDRMDFSRDLTASINEAGIIYQTMGDAKKALEYFEKSMKVMESLVAKKQDRTDFSSGLAESYNNMGNYYSKMGDAKKALEYFEKSIKLMESLLTNEPDRTDFSRDLTVVIGRAAKIYSDMRDGKKALEYLKQSMKVMETLVAKEPDRSDFSSLLIASFNNVAGIYSDMGDERKALEYFEKSMKLMEFLVAKEPDRTDLRYDLIVIFNNMGNIYSGMGDAKKAMEYSEKSMMMVKFLVAKEPDRTDFSHALTVNLRNGGNIYKTMGDARKAMEYFEKSMKILESLLAQEPYRTDFSQSLALSYTDVGKNYHAMVDVKNASEYFEKSFKVLESLVAKEPERIDFKIDFAINHWFRYMVCQKDEELLWLQKTKNILEPLILAGVKDQQIEKLCGLVNEAIEENS